MTLGNLWSKISRTLRSRTMAARLTPLASGKSQSRPAPKRATHGSTWTSPNAHCMRTRSAKGDSCETTTMCAPHCHLTGIWWRCFILSIPYDQKRAVKCLVKEFGADPNQPVRSTKRSNQPTSVFPPLALALRLPLEAAERRHPRKARWRPSNEVGAHNPIRIPYASKLFGQCSVVLQQIPHRELRRNFRGSVARRY